MMGRISSKTSTESLSNVERAMKTIELLSDANDGLSISELARQLNVNKSIAFRILNTLEELRFVYRKSSTQQYRLTFRISNLALRQMANSGLLDQSVPALRELAERTGELVRLAIVENGRPIWVHAESGVQRRLRIDPVYSHEITLHSLATAKAWLFTLPEDRVDTLLGPGPFEAFTKYTLTTLRALKADLARSRRCGFAISYEEHELGVGTVAAPIMIPGFDGRFECVGVVSVAAPTSRVDRTSSTQNGQLVIATAEHLAAAWPRRLLSEGTLLSGSSSDRLYRSANVAAKRSNQISRALGGPIDVPD